MLLIKYNQSYHVNVRIQENNEINSIYLRYSHRKGRSLAIAFYFYEILLLFHDMFFILQQNWSWNFTCFTTELTLYQSAKSNLNLKYKRRANLPVPCVFLKYSYVHIINLCSLRQRKSIKQYRIISHTHLIRFQSNFCIPWSFILFIYILFAFKMPQLTWRTYYNQAHKTIAYLVNFAVGGTS